LHLHRCVYIICNIFILLPLSYFSFFSRNSLFGFLAGTSESLRRLRYLCGFCLSRYVRFFPMQCYFEYLYQYWFYNCLNLPYLKLWPIHFNDVQEKYTFWLYLLLVLKHGNCALWFVFSSSLFPSFFIPFLYHKQWV
jgi:hypothetical protein